MTAPGDGGCPALCGSCGAFMSDWYACGGGLWECALCGARNYPDVGPSDLREVEAAGDRGRKRFGF